MNVYQNYVIFSLILFDLLIIHSSFSFSMSQELNSYVDLDQCPSHQSFILSHHYLLKTSFLHHSLLVSHHLMINLNHKIQMFYPKLESLEIFFCLF